MFQATQMYDKREIEHKIALSHGAKLICLDKLEWIKLKKEETSIDQSEFLALGIEYEKMKQELEYLDIEEKNLQKIFSILSHKELLK